LDWLIDFFVSNQLIVVAVVLQGYKKVVFISTIIELVLSLYQYKHSSEL